MKESGENYLETILQLERNNTIVRSSDIATALGYSKPSVNKAMNVLKKAGYITQERYGNIYLTESGREKAKKVLSKHNMIMTFLVDVLNVTPKTAQIDACKIEHIISDETIEKINRFTKKNDK
ncbi:MAG: metal-dependent transcriptional regulator [Oscillospiraceae bacterium]